METPTSSILIRSIFAAFSFILHDHRIDIQGHQYYHRPINRHSHLAGRPQAHLK